MSLVHSLLRILWRAQACTTYGNPRQRQELIQSLLYSKSIHQMKPTSAISVSVLNVVVVQVETRQMLARKILFNQFDNAICYLFIIKLEVF